jgi:dCMP deaminase
MISASRNEMLGGILYLVGYRTESHSYEEGAAPCLLCRKMIINAGIEKVYVRVSKDEYKLFLVEDWIKDDELLRGQLEY